MSKGFRISRISAELVEVAFEGSLTAPGVTTCDQELRAQLALAQAGSLRAVVDLGDVERYTLEAREALVSLQTFLGTKARATAYIGASALQRALSLWARHLVEGQEIRCFADRSAGTAWLTDGVGPITGVRPLARARELAFSDENKATG